MRATQLPLDTGRLLLLLVALMSNTPLDANLPANPPSPDGICYRLAHPQEHPAAAGMILAEGRWPASAAQITEVLNPPHERAIDLSQIWVAEQRGKVLWTLLPVRSPGRTMLLLFPVHIS